MNREIRVLVLRAGSVGGLFFKEMGRFLSCFDKNNWETCLDICDYADVEEEDLYDEPFLLDDVGWKKASSIAKAVKDNFLFDKSSVVIHSYAMDLTDEDKVDSLLQNRKYSYGNTASLLIVCNCIQNKKISDIVQANLSMSVKNAIYLSYTEDGLETRIFMTGASEEKVMKNEYADTLHFSRATARKIAYGMLSKVLP